MTSPIASDGCAIVGAVYESMSVRDSLLCKAVLNGPSANDATKDSRREPAKVERRIFPQFHDIHFRLSDLRGGDNTLCANFRRKTGRRSGIHRSLRCSGSGQGVDG